MSEYQSSEEVNTNIIETNERKDLGQQFLSPTSSADNSRIGCPLSPYCVNQSYLQFGQPFVTCEGFITLFVSKDIRVDISSNHSICVTLPHAKASFDQMGDNVGLIHPFGRIFQESEQSSVHIESGVHLAKMCSRGVTFTSLNRSLIYLVDTSGCKTTTERFRRLSYDFTADIFHSNSLSGEYARQRAFADLLRVSTEVSEDRSEVIWNIAGFRLRYNSMSGDLIITKSWKLSIHLSPNQNKNHLKIITPNLRLVVSNRTEGFLQIIRPDPHDEQRVVISIDRFQVKNGSQKAGFDNRDQLVLM